MKIIQRVSLIAGLNFFLIGFAVAQENFMSGYIIHLNGDTAKGFVDYRYWKSNPGNVSFKYDLNEISINYFPLEIREFGVLGEIYTGAIIQTEISIASVLEVGSELMMQTDTTFLQTMISGSKSLYYYKSVSGKELFYFRHENKYEWLVYKKYLKEFEGGFIVSENNKFKGQLAVYLDDCPEILTKLNKLKYTRKSFEKLFLDYYSCINTDYSFNNFTSNSDSYAAKKASNILPEFGILGGVSVSAIEFEGTSPKYIVYGDFKPSFNFSGGVYMDLVFVRTNRRISINNELLYYSYKFSDSYYEYVSPQHITDSYTELGFSTVKYNSMLRYKYPVGNAFLYGNLGFTLATFQLSKTNYLKQDITYFAPLVTTEGKASSDEIFFETCTLFGLGCRYNRFSFETRMEFGTGPLYTITLDSKSLRSYFLLGYRF